MTPATFLVALLAAGAGALAWAAVSYFTGYEVGYVAWGIGALVGVATAKFGGHGTPCALAAAALAVAGIAGGKLLGTRFVVEKQIQESCEETFTPELHAEFMRDAADLARLGADAGDDELREFMVEHRYTPADSAAEVEADELQAFRNTNVPDLLALHANRTSHADWLAQRIAESRQAFEQDFSIVQANIDELNGYDLLFAALGISTAFGIVRRAGAPGTGPGGQVASFPDQKETRKAA